MLWTWVMATHQCGSAPQPLKRKQPSTFQMPCRQLWLLDIFYSWSYGHIWHQYLIRSSRVSQKRGWLIIRLFLKIAARKGYVSRCSLPLPDAKSQSLRWLERAHSAPLKRRNGLSSSCYRLSKIHSKLVKLREKLCTEAYSGQRRTEVNFQFGNICLLLMRL